MYPCQAPTATNSQVHHSGSFWQLTALGPDVENQPCTSHHTMARFINHPLYTPPPETRTIILLALGFACELANAK